jgi:hypothetical protein
LVRCTTRTSATSTRYHRTSRTFRSFLDNTISSRIVWVMTQRRAKS